MGHKMIIFSQNTFAFWFYFTNVQFVKIPSSSLHHRSWPCERRGRFNLFLPLLLQPKMPKRCWLVCIAATVCCTPSPSLVPAKNKVTSNWAYARRLFSPHCPSFYPPVHISQKANLLHLHMLICWLEKLLSCLMWFLTVNFMLQNLIISSGKAFSWMTHVVLTASKTLLCHYTINLPLWPHLGTPQDKQRRRGPNDFHFNVKKLLDCKTHALEQPTCEWIISSQTHMHSYDKYYKSKCIKVML